MRDPTADPSESGQGETYLLTVTLTTNGSGLAAFSVKVKPAVAAGDVISATATSPLQNTSAYSADVTVNASGVTVVSDAAAAVPVDFVLGSLSTNSSDSTDAVLTELAVDLVQTGNRQSGNGS